MFERASTGERASDVADDVVQVMKQLSERFALKESVINDQDAI